MASLTISSAADVIDPFAVDKQRAFRAIEQCFDQQRLQLIAHRSSRILPTGSVRKICTPAPAPATARPAAGTAWSFRRKR